MTLRPFARVVAVLVACTALASCRVDTNVDLSVNPNGSGKVTVTVTADADVVKAAPNLRTDVRNDDLRSAGWKTQGPDDTKDGGLTVTFSHEFRTPAEATTLLAQVNDTKGPLKAVALARSGKNSNSTFTLSGTLEVNGGLEAFADDAAIKLIGSAPYAEQVAASGQDLGKVLGITFTASLPGTVKQTTGTPSGNVISWRVPTDGTPTDVATVTNNVDIASNIARIGRWLLVAILVVWVAGTLVLALMVASRRPRTPRP